MSQKFCSNCGAPLSPGAKHCSSCGNAIPSENTAQPYPPVQDAYQRPQYTPQPSGNNDMVKVLIGILIVLVMAGIGLGIWLFAGKSKEPVSQETNVQQETIKEMKASNDSMKASYDQLKKQIEKKSKEPVKVQYVKEKPTSVSRSGWRTKCGCAMIIGRGQCLDTEFIRSFEVISFLGRGAFQQSGHLIGTTIKLVAAI